MVGAGVQFLKLSLIAGLLLLGGCISSDTPGDLAVTSVQVVDWNDQPELVGPEGNPLSGLVIVHGTQRLRLPTLGEKKRRPMLKVEFTSATNLSQLTHEHSYNLGNNAFLCSRGDVHSYISYPSVYSNGQRLGNLGPDRIDARNDRQIVYYIFVDVAEEANTQEVPPRIAYDLRKKPESVCFSLSGGNESGCGFKSNTVVIPEDMIAAALEKVTSPPGR